MNDNKWEKAAEIGEAIVPWAVCAVCVEAIAILTWVWCVWF